MLPIVEVPASIREILCNYRELFRRKEGYEHVSRYITGLILSPNKTLEGIYKTQYYPDKRPSRRAMHESVFESNGWNSEELMKAHRNFLSKQHRGRGREVISLDSTHANHHRGPQIHGTKKRYDYVSNQRCLYQCLITAVICNPHVLDGLDIVLQYPKYEKEELDYLKYSERANYEKREEVLSRLLELLCYKKNRLEYKKKWEIAVEVVKKIEEEGNFPEAHYAFDSNFLVKQLAEVIEKNGKHWVSEVACNRNIMWKGEWTRVDKIDEELKREEPWVYREHSVICRNGKKKDFRAFTKVVRVKKLGRKRLVIVHEEKDLSDEPRFLLTDANHWESSKIMQTWSYRWSIEIFHEFTKQVTGLESSQVREEKAVKRHFHLSCVAQSLIQRAPVNMMKSEKDKTKEKITFGDKSRAIAKEAFYSMLKFVKSFFSQGKTCREVLSLLIPGGIAGRKLCLNNP